MYGSEDLNLPFPGSGGSDNQEKEESDLFPHQNHHRISSGLVQYPWPSHGSATPETESMFARFMTDKQPLEAVEQRSSQLPMPLMAEEATRSGRELQHSSSNLQMLFQSPQQHQPQLQSLNSESPYGVMGSVTAADVEQQRKEEEEQAKSGCGVSSNLIRHSSSPAGFLSRLNVENGFNMMRGMGEAGAGGDTSSGRLKGQLSFSSRQGSDEGGGMGSGDSNASGSGRCYIPGYPSSWEDSALLSESLSGSKRPRGHRSKSGLEMKNQYRNHVSDLSSSEMNPVMERYLEFQDAVPCKIRAKRGCATHPRSIAERMRRTKISERMRKLQDLVPNMDKQANTSDMLDLAVAHIKDLQKTVKTLSDDRGRCRCGCEQKT